MTIGNPTYNDLFICAPCRNADHELCIKNISGYNREVLGQLTTFSFTGCSCACKRIEKRPRNPSGI